MIALRLKIENEDSLPDGGPLVFTLTGRRGIDIGRDSHLDWVLPDPSRVVSGKHCEIRFRDGGYWLRDVSSNGTYINGSSARLAEPRRLRDGDRLEIGRYLIAVSVTGDAASGEPDSAAPMVANRQPAEDLWGVEGDVAPHAPVGRQRRSRPVADFDFMDSAGDMPEPIGESLKPDEAWPSPSKGINPPVADADWLDVKREPTPVPIPAPMPAEAISSAAARFAFETGDAFPAENAVPQSAITQGKDDGGARFIALFEKSAGLPASALKDRQPDELAQDLGRMMLVVAGELKTLMRARAESKGAMRSTNHTSVQALDNNPIPFAPTAEDALHLMLARQGRSYLSGEAALLKTFEALKSHQMDTFVAMQGALEGLLHELDPTEVERNSDPEGAVGNLFGARKARLWDLYRARWQALAASHPDGLRGAFMSLFTAHYDKRSARK